MNRFSAEALEDVLTESQVRHLDKCVGSGHWQLLGSSLQPAAEGQAGFIGNHFKLTLKVKEDGQIQTLKLFVKSVPRQNSAKIRFIEDNGFFKREMTVFKLLEEMETVPNRCVTNALFYSDSVLVMPDLTAEGYSTRDQVETFDLSHVRATLASVARFHAAFANLETRKGLALQRPYSLMEEHAKVIVETTFQDTAWVRAAAKLTVNIIRLTKYKSLHSLEDNVLRQFLGGCKDLTEGSFNVMLHKDLWVNNIMFKYEDGVPTSSILVDFQCVRYGPPAFDVTMLLYLTTSRSFRQQHEACVLRYYFKTFTESLDVETKLKLQVLGYDYEEFLSCVDVARRFGMVAALTIFPFVLMDPKTAAKVFDDPATYDQLMYEDRTLVVLAHAARCPRYGERQIEPTKEFVEKFLLL